MKYIYPDELCWMQHRDRVRKQGYFTRRADTIVDGEVVYYGHMFRLIALASDEQLQGFDLYTVENPEDKATSFIALVKWNREELAGQVQEQIVTRPLDDALEFFQLFNEQMMTGNLQIVRQSPELEIDSSSSY